MFCIAYAFNGQVHVFAGRVKIGKSFVLQYKCNIEIFCPLSTVYHANYIMLPGLVDTLHAKTMVISTWRKLPAISNLASAKFNPGLKTTPKYFTMI